MLEERKKSVVIKGARAELIGIIRWSRRVTITTSGTMSERAPARAEQKRPLGLRPLESEVDQEHEHRATASGLWPAPATTMTIGLECASSESAGGQHKSGPVINKSCRFLLGKSLSLSLNCCRCARASKILLAFVRVVRANQFAGERVFQRNKAQSDFEAAAAATKRSLIKFAQQTSSGLGQRRPRERESERADGGAAAGFCWRARRSTGGALSAQLRSNQTDTQRSNERIATDSQRGANLNNFVCNLKLPPSIGPRCG